MRRKKTGRKLYESILNCRVCDRSDLEEVLDLGLQALSGVFPKDRQDRVAVGPLRLLRCSECGLVQLADGYDPSVLYGENYGYRSGLNGSMVRHLHDVVAKVESRIELRPNDLVIDIGSNDGTLLGGYSAKGLRRLGVDTTATKFREHYPDDVDVIEDFFSAEAVRNLVGGKRARVVTSIAMFYDLEHPLDLVRDVVEVLAPDGLWVMEQSYLPAMVTMCAYDTVCHEHLEYYTMRDIAGMIGRFGLKVVDVELNDVNGGSFCVTVSRDDAPYAKDGIASTMMLSEETGGYSTDQPFAEFRERITTQRRELRSVLEDLRRKGKRVLGYGASTKGNVLLQYCGIDQSWLPCIAEVNEDKFGCFTPGTGIPIVSEQVARAMEPDYYLVLPWHFRSGIVEKEREFLSNGGGLIFPLPKVEVVTG